MIVSVSRRTDIPALYADWFFHRLSAKTVCTKNPFNRKQVRKVSLAEEDVTGFVFWTRNPEPFLNKIHRLKGYAYYFHVTLTPYGSDLEPAFKDKERILASVKKLAGLIGKERIVWRYDPVLLSKQYRESDHYAHFEECAKRLSGSVNEVTVSFVNAYRKNAKALEKAGIETLSDAKKRKMAKRFMDIAYKYGITLSFCAEPALQEARFPAAKCVDEQKFARLKGKSIPYEKDPNQRGACGCAKSVDIGAYDTCTFGCGYCYATNRRENALQNKERHHQTSPFLLGDFMGDETITHLPGKRKSCDKNLFTT